MTRHSRQQGFRTETGSAPTLFFIARLAGRLVG